ncbi:hypothetical protein AYO44_18595 [Planctomycetaceae bacterium SCGC AG-212-F19]|nr:hypothetical protein AYO44_18595 [Planctomycetaceae bacterium SCGC AG-212-F19]
MSPLRLFAVSSSVCLAILAATAEADQRTDLSAVQRLQSILQADAKTPEDRKDRLRLLDDLTSPKSLPDTELASALALDSWKDLDRHVELRAVDAQVREKLIARFEKWVAGQLDRRGPAALDTKLAVLTLLGEMGVNVYRTAGDRKVALAAKFAPKLIPLLKDPNADVRAAAARALGKINPDPEPATKAFAEMLARESAQDRRAAADGLAGMMRVLVPMMVSRSSAPVVDMDRAEAVQRARVVAMAAGPGLKQDDPAARRACLEALHLAAHLLAELGNVLPRDIGAPGRPPTAEEQARIKEYRTEVERTSKEVRPLAGAVQAQLDGVIRCLSDATPDVLIAACQALESAAEARNQLRQGEPAEKSLNGLAAAAPPLAALLPHTDVRVRLAALYVLETMPDLAEPAVPALVKALTDADAFVRWGAVRAVGKRAPADAAAVVPGLGKLIADENGDVRLTALTALERYGPAAKAGVPALVEGVSRGDTLTRLGVIRALGALGKEAQPAVAALAGALTAAEPEVRVAVAQTLGRLGPLASAAIPALRKALNDANPDVRRATSTALLTILGG